MKKKIPKSIKRKIRKLENEARFQREKRLEAEEKAKFYEDRFRRFGSNVETIDPGNGECVVMEKWTIEQLPWGRYVPCCEDISDEEIEKLKESIVEGLVRGLIEKNLVQFILKERNTVFPIAEFKTLAAKLYVVPWEQMPHARTLELEQFVKNTLEGGEDRASDKERITQ